MNQCNYNPAELPQPRHLAQMLADRFKKVLIFDAGGWLWRDQPVTPGWLYNLVFWEISVSYSWVNIPPWFVTQIFDQLPQLLEKP